MLFNLPFFKSSADIKWVNILVQSYPCRESWYLTSRTQQFMFYWTPSPSLLLKRLECSGSFKETILDVRLSYLLEFMISALKAMIRTCFFSLTDTCTSVRQIHHILLASNTHVNPLVIDLYVLFQTHFPKSSNGISLYSIRDVTDFQGRSSNYKLHLCLALLQSQASGSKYA